MNNEAILKIKAAEEESAAAVSRAKQTAADMLAGAKTGRSEAINNAEAECLRIAAEARQRAKELSDKKADEARESARSEAKQLIASSDKNMKEAVGLIVRGIFEKWQ